MSFRMGSPSCSWTNVGYSMRKDVLFQGGLRRQRAAAEGGRRPDDVMRDLSASRPAARFGERRASRATRAHEVRRFAPAIRRTSCAESARSAGRADDRSRACGRQPEEGREPGASAEERRNRARASKRARPLQSATIMPRYRAKSAAEFSTNPRRAVIFPWPLLRV